MGGVHICMYVSIYMCVCVYDRVPDIQLNKAESESVPGYLQLPR